MTAELRRGLVLAILGLLAGLVLVTVSVGDGRFSYDRVARIWRGGPAPDAAAPAPAPGGPVLAAKPPGQEADPSPGPAPTGSAGPGAPDAGRAAEAGPAPVTSGPAPPVQTRGDPGGIPDVKSAGSAATEPKPVVDAKSQGPSQQAPSPQGSSPQVADGARPAPARGEPARPAAAGTAKPQAPPVFDVIRVEPSGEAVIAGRGAPGATIEMMRGGETFARALADPSGLFAIVPPTLPKGTSEITLRSIGPDGVRTGSKDTAVIVVPASGAAKPLIALTSPDKPTVVLSQPEAAVAARPATETPGAPATSPAQTPVKVVSVDAESGGRLFVTAQAPPGATVRLYLNDTLVAPASAGQDGRVSFAIGRGVQAGQYKVRIDQVDPVSAEVRARSEVPFNFPVALAGPPPATATVMSRSPEAEAEARPRVEDLAHARPPEAAAKPTAATPSTPDGPAVAAAPPGSRAPASGQSPRGPSAAPAPGAVASAPQESAAPPPATPPSGQVYIPELATLTVSRGDNLWNISRKSYGRGARYTVIYDANQDQIRNPALIYPGQIFVLPQRGEGHQARQH